MSVRGLERERGRQMVKECRGLLYEVRGQGGSGGRMGSVFEEEDGGGDLPPQSIRITTAPYRDWDKTDLDER